MLAQNSTSSQLCFRLIFFIYLEAKGDADLEVKIYRKILSSMSFECLHFFVRLE